MGSIPFDIGVSIDMIGESDDQDTVLESRATYCQFTLFGMNHRQRQASPWCSSWLSCEWKGENEKIVLLTLERGIQNESSFGWIDLL